MNIKKVALRVFQYCFLILFVGAVFAGLYGVKKARQILLQNKFYQEMVKP